MIMYKMNILIKNKQSLNVRYGKIEKFKLFFIKNMDMTFIYEVIYPQSKLNEVLPPLL